MTAKEAHDFFFDETETLTDAKVWFSIVGSIMYWRDKGHWYANGGRTIGLS